jgi:hypothetical protein
LSLSHATFPFLAAVSTFSARGSLLLQHPMET